jgi:hypothetical protein
MAISVKDIGFDDDLIILNGDFSVEFSDEAHVEDILDSYLGHWKQFPLLGVGIEREVNSNTNKQQIVKRKIQQQLESDGYKVGQISLKYNDTAKVLDYNIEFERIKNERVQN